MVKRLLLTRIDHTFMEKIELAEIIKVLGRSKVIEILKALRNNEKSLTELQFEVHAQISTTQRAVEALTEIGLIQRKEKKRNGKRVTVYQLTPLGMEVLSWLDDFDRRARKLTTVSY